MSSFGVEDITEDSFVYDMKLLLGSMILGVKHVLLLIPAQGSGCVINNASIVGFASGYGPRVYSCATGHRSGIDPKGIHTFPRCVMTTLPRVDLPHDSRILRTAAQLNTQNLGDFGSLPCVGVYADVVKPGPIRHGDPVRAFD